MSVHEEINRAIAAHGMWKSRLLGAIQTGKSEYSPSTVQRDDQCDFGKWLRNGSAELKTSPHYRKCCDLHSQFHKAAGSVLTLALAGKKAEASKAIEPGSQFANLSGSLVTELMAWNKEAS